MKDVLTTGAVAVLAILFGRALFGYLGGGVRFLWNRIRNPKARIHQYFNDKAPADGISSNDNVNRIVGFVVFAIVLIVLKGIL